MASIARRLSSSSGRPRSRRGSTTLPSTSTIASIQTSPWMPRRVASGRVLRIDLADDLRRHHTARHRHGPPSHADRHSRHAVGHTEGKVLISLAKVRVGGLIRLDRLRVVRRRVRDRDRCGGLLLLGLPGFRRRCRRRVALHYRCRGCASSGTTSSSLTGKISRNAMKWNTSAAMPAFLRVTSRSSPSVKYSVTILAPTARRRCGLEGALGTHPGPALVLLAAKRELRISAAAEIHKSDRVSPEPSTHMDLIIGGARFCGL